MAVIIVFTHVVRPSVPTFQNIAKQNKFQVITKFTTVCLAEWIIDDICLVFILIDPPGPSRLGGHYFHTSNRSAYPQTLLYLTFQQNLLTCSIFSGIPLTGLETWDLRSTSTTNLLLQEQCHKVRRIERIPIKNFNLTKYLNFWPSSSFGPVEFWQAWLYLWRKL